MKLKNIGSILAGSVAMLVATAILADQPASSTATTTPAASTGTIKCSGTNACKGQSACKTATNACKGQNSCKGKGISMVNTEKDCTDAGGTVVKDTETK